MQSIIAILLQSAVHGLRVKLAQAEEMLGTTFEGTGREQRENEMNTGDLKHNSDEDREPKEMQRGHS